MNEPECSDPGAVSPEDLLAYLDGNATPRVIEHLKSCAHCAAEVRSYRDAERGLRQILYRVDCPSPQTLGEYEMGLVSPTERQQIAAHVFGCDRCTDELRQLREFMAGGLLPVQPDDLAGTIRRIVATLLPSAVSPAFVGLRGTSDGAARVYQAGNLLLALEWTADARPGRFALVGLAMQEATMAQTDERDLADRPVRLIVDGTERTEWTDELGNFQFDDLAPGDYRLELDFGGEVIVVDDLQLRF